jgi:hypothetical protein
MRAASGHTVTSCVALFKLLLRLSVQCVVGVTVPRDDSGDCHGWFSTAGGTVWRCEVEMVLQAS